MHSGSNVKKKASDQLPSRPIPKKESKTAPPPPRVLHEKQNVNIASNASKGEPSGKRPQPQPPASAPKEQKPSSQHTGSARPSAAPQQMHTTGRPSNQQQSSQGAMKPARAIMTQRNKYAHVPAKVVTTTSHGVRDKVATGGKAAQHPKKSTGTMSHEDFFGHGGKKTEHVKSVLHRSSYITSKATKQEETKSLGSIREQAPEAEATDSSKRAQAASPATSSATTPSPVPVPAPPAHALSFKDLVMDASADLPARRSLSAPRLPDRSSGSLPLPLPRPQQPPSARTTEGAAAASSLRSTQDGTHVNQEQQQDTEGPPGRTSKGGWLQWLMSPKAVAHQGISSSDGCTPVVFPVGTDAEDGGARSSRWSMHESFRGNADAVHNGNDGTAVGNNSEDLEVHDRTMSDVLTLRTNGTTDTTHNGHRTDPNASAGDADLRDRASRSLTLTRHSSDTALTAVSPLTDMSRKTTSGRAGSEEFRTWASPSKQAEGAIGRQSTNSLRSSSAAGQPGAPPNTPMGGRASEGGAGRWSTNSIGSVAQPGAPPNTPMGGRASEGGAGRWSTNSIGSVTQPGAPPNTPMTGRPSVDNNELSPNESQPRRSGSWMDALWGTPRQAPPSPSAALHEDSVAPFDIPSPPPTLPPGHVGTDVVSTLAAEPRGSTEMGWFDRIRSSLLLRPAARGVEAPSPGNETPGELGARRRKSVQFCDPDELEVRVDDACIDRGTPRRSVRNHNEDPSSPVPILVRSSSGRLSGRYSVGGTLVPPPNDPSSLSEEDDALRSDSPSRRRTEEPPSPCAATPNRTEQPMAHEPTLLSPPVVAPNTTPPVGQQNVHASEISLPLPPPPAPTPRPHKVDRLGRVCRSKTPGRTSGRLSPPDEMGDTAVPAVAVSEVPPRHPGCSLMAHSPMLPLESPPPRSKPSTAADSSRVASVLQQHTIASALRLLTTMEIASYLAANDVDFDPADRKSKLLDTARKLALHPASRERRSTSGSESLGLDSSRAPSFTFSISLPQPEHKPASGKRGRQEDDQMDRVENDDDELPIPTSTWTVSDIRDFAQRRGISLQGVPQRKAEYLRRISSSIGRSRSASMM